MRFNKLTTGGEAVARFVTPRAIYDIINSIIDK